MKRIILNLTVLLSILSLISPFAAASTWYRFVLDTGDMYTGTHNSVAIDISPWNYAIYITYIYGNSIKCAANYGHG
ncbi:hypothetical protein HXY33_02605 [Candidatus Bathyarchaeota archaeon]|nr:hypothetical protein [Candidatus Bathyarchaeota archaeon]